MNILIVDDEQFAIQGMLDGINWDLLDFDKVLTACSYEEAVKNGQIAVIGEETDEAFLKKVMQQAINPDAVKAVAD